MKSKYLTGQTEKQRRNSEEQSKRRDDIKRKFSRTIEYHTHIDLLDIIEKKQLQLSKIFDKLGLKYRKAELRSLVISYYIRIADNPEMKNIVRFIYLNLIKQEESLKKVLLKLNKKYPDYEWTEDSLREYFLFKNGKK